MSEQLAHKYHVECFTGQRFVFEATVEALEEKEAKKAVMRMAQSEGHQPTHFEAKLLPPFQMKIGGGAQAKVVGPGAKSPGTGDGPQPLIEAPESVNIEPQPWVY